MNCRNCQAPLRTLFVDLGTSPLSNGYLDPCDLDIAEPRWPLRPHICDVCRLVQLPVYETPESIFGGEYPFFSGQSASWVEHCAAFCRGAARRLGLTRQSRVVEIASNDGVLVRQMQAVTPQVVGVEPARNVALHALKAGAPTINRFFGKRLAAEMVEDGWAADLVVANNVLAHVPDLDDFLDGVRMLLAGDGVLSVEFPDLDRLVADNQFDTIYHEHFSYFSLHTARRVLERRGLYAFSMERVETHGGSLRLWASRDPSRATSPELAEGMQHEARHDAYAAEPAKLKQRFLLLIEGLRADGLRIAGYGAPAKATTFLTYCGVGAETFEFIVDSTPAKQGRFLPGARIPILPPEALVEEQPDVIVILPWNWRDEIAAKIARDCKWGPMVICRDEVLSAGAERALAA